MSKLRKIDFGLGWTLLNIWPNGYSGGSPRLAAWSFKSPAQYFFLKLRKYENLQENIKKKYTQKIFM